MKINWNTFFMLLKKQIASWLIPIAISGFSASNIRSVQAVTLTLKESFNLQSSLYSSATALDSLTEIGALPRGNSFNLNSSFSESGFTSDITGSIRVSSDFIVPFSLQETGVLTGDEGSDINVNVSSTGTFGSETISVNTDLLFSFDSVENEYTQIDINQQGEINPFWGAAIRVVGLLIAGIGTLDSPEISNSKQFTTTMEIPGVGERECLVIYNDPISTSSCIVDYSTNSLTATFVTPSTPEPSSTIGLITLGILGGGLTLKRKLKSANSTEK